MNVFQEEEVPTEIKLKSYVSDLLEEFARQDKTYIVYVLNPSEGLVHAVAYTDFNKVVRDKTPYQFTVTYPVFADLMTRGREYWGMAVSELSTIECDITRMFIEKYHL